MTIIAAMPHKALSSPTRGTAAFEAPELEADPPVEDEPLPEGAVGVAVAGIFDKHEDAAAFAAPTSEGAALLIVAFPAKLQDCELRLLA